uniref:MADS-box domain-containing protein n=1 Tax=Oryza punctata TaxID=4537 RepID=A0A0E0MLN4_ORYPU
MAHLLGRTSMGRQRIEIRRIDNKERRQVTFTKRRGGLFKKASELALLTGASVAVVVFSEANHTYAFGHLSVDAVLRSYAPVPGEAAAAAPVPVHGEDVDLHWLRIAADEIGAQVAAEQARMRGVAAQIVQAKAGRRFWWEADVDALGEAQLPEFVKALKKLRDNVGRHVNALLAPQPPPLLLQ